jgi:hypothetical protein
MVVIGCHVCSSLVDVDADDRLPAMACRFLIDLVPTKPSWERRCASGGLDKRGFWWRVWPGRATTTLEVHKTVCVGLPGASEIDGGFRMRRLQSPPLALCILVRRYRPKVGDPPSLSLQQRRQRRHASMPVLLSEFITITNYLCGPGGIQLALTTRLDGASRK